MNCIANNSRIFLILLFSVLVMPAQASIYKCKGSNGKIVFSGEPCGDGRGGKFNLGATVEDSDPTGTGDDVSGSFGALSKSYSIQDALGVLRKSKSELSLYMSPTRFSNADVEHFQEIGDASILKNKPSLDVSSLSSFPYLNLVVIFKKGLPLTQENIASVQVKMFGLQPSAKPIEIKYKAEEAKEVIPYMTIFEDVTQGDINMDAESTTNAAEKPTRWKISIRAPIYFH